MCMSGCLGSPAERTCADYPRDTPGCAEYWGDAPDGAADGAGLDARADAARDGGAPDGMHDGMADDMSAVGRDGMPGDMADGMTDGMADAAPDATADLGACAPGDTVACGSDEGECSAGTRACVGGVFGECEGAVGPGVELCNGLDDNCDGTIDNTARAGLPCSTGVGACEVAGVLVCVPGGPPMPVCDAVEPEGRAESCNGADDDCDGFVDEGIEQRLRTLRLPSMDADTAPAMAELGEFFAMVWIGPEGGLGFASFAGESYEVEPYAYQEFDGGDTEPLSVALAGSEAGPVLAMSYCDVGGCGVAVSALDEGGNLRRTRYVEGTNSDVITVATNGEAAGVAWQAPGMVAQLGIGFAHVDSFDGPRLGSVLIESPAALYTQPSLAWAGGRYGMVYLAAEPDTGEVVEFRAIDANGGTLVQTILSGPGATGPRIVALRGHAGFLVSWVEPVRQVPTVRAAVVDRMGLRVAGPFDLGEGVEATPIGYETGLGARVDRAAVGWLVPVNNRRYAAVRWLDFVDGEWVVRAVARLGDVRQRAGGLVGAYSVDSGPGFGWRDFDGASYNPLVVSGGFGCPTGPGLP